MKKSTVLMMFAIGTGLVSCSQGPKANLKSDVDSLSYMMGISQSQGVIEYVTGRYNVDTAYIADFIKGIEQGAKVADAKQQAYMAGMQIGQQVGNDMFNYVNTRLFQGDSTQSLNKENFLAGFIAAVQNKGLVSNETANRYVQEKATAIQEKALETQYADYKKENEEFLAKNKTKEGIQTTPSGLQYKVITKGTGAVPTDSSTVKVHYKGTLIDGTQFDSSYDRKEPFVTSVKGVIKGWTEALTMMPVGSKWELYIPQELAYGAMVRQGSPIKPFSTLIFEVELLGIEK